jgi:site-specific DNA recombinase
VSLIDKRAPLRALIYDRVSVDQSGLARSVASQDVENRAFCERQGWVIVGTIEDNDLSASPWAKKERPGYAEARRRMAAGEVDVLVCWEASRAQRDLAVYVELRDLCLHHSVLWAYSGRVYDLSRTDDRFTTGLDALLAEREVGQVRDRILRDVRTHAAVGGVHGTVPFGYRREYDQHTGALTGQVPDEATAPIVQEIVARLIAGDTLYGIVLDLNARDVPTPQGYKDQLRGLPTQYQGWTSSKIRRLMSSRSIIGVRSHRGVEHPTPTWTPLVSREDYELALQVLADPHRAVHHRGVAVKYLLSGIATCGPCGAWLRPGRVRGQAMYQCAGHGDARGKGHVGREMARLDALVTVRVVDRLRDPGLLAALASRGDDASAAEAVKEAAGLRAHLARLEDDVANQRMSGAAFGRIEARILDQIRAAEASLSGRPTLPPSVVNMAAPDAAERWAAIQGDIVRCRLIVRSLVQVIVHRSNVPRGSRVFDESSIEILDR